MGAFYTKPPKVTTPWPENYLLDFHPFEVISILFQP